MKFKMIMCQVDMSYVWRVYGRAVAGNALPMGQECLLECICKDVFDKFYLNSASCNFTLHDPDHGLGWNVNQFR